MDRFGSAPSSATQLWLRIWKALCAPIEIHRPLTQYRPRRASDRRSPGLLAARTRQGQQAASEVGQRFLALVELADQLFSLGAALGDSLAVSAPSHSDPVLIEAVHAIAVAIAGRTYTEVTHHLVDRLEQLYVQEPEDDSSGLRARIAAVLLTTLHVA